MKYVNEKSKITEYRETDSFLKLEKEYRVLFNRKSVFLNFLTKTDDKMENRIQFTLSKAIQYSNNPITLHIDLLSGNKHILNLMSLNHAENFDKIIENDILSKFEEHIDSYRNTDIVNFILNKIKKMENKKYYTGKYFVVGRPQMFRKLDLGKDTGEYKGQVGKIDNIYFIESNVINNHNYYILCEDFQKIKFKVKPTIDLVGNEYGSKSMCLIYYSEIKLEYKDNYKNCLKIKMIQ